MSNITDVNYVVILMQENRSFDEYFGTFPGATGFSDPAGTFSNLYGLDPSLAASMPAINDIKPFRMSTFTSIGLQRPGDGHFFDTFQQLYNNGAVGQYIWQEAPAPNSASPSILGYYAADDIPVHWALASAFTLCDHYFGSALSATAPNRLYLMSGCVQDPISNRPLPSIPQPVWRGPAIGESLGGFTADDPNPPPQQPYGSGWLSWPSYSDMLTAAGVSWTVYDETNLTGGAVQATNPNQQNGWGTLNLLPVFASWIATPPTASQNPQTNTQTLPAQPQTQTTQFESDAANGKLNKVVWIMPPFWASEWENNHPSDGGAYIIRKLNAILDGKDADGNPLWNSTIFIVIYDESGGHFDHVMPPGAPAGTPDETSATNQPFGAGFRAPALVISPWTLNQGVNSTYFDHTSVLQLLESVTNVPCANLPVPCWRRNTFHNLADVLNFNTTPASVADVRAILPWVQQWTQPLPDAPPKPTMADAYAFYANQRLQSVLSANPSASLTPPAAQTEAPWSPPVTQSIELIMPDASYDLAQASAIAVGGTATFPTALRVAVYGFEPDELVDPNAVNQNFAAQSVAGHSFQTRYPAIAFTQNGIPTNQIVANLVSIDSDPTVNQPASGVPRLFMFSYDIEFLDLSVFPAMPAAGAEGTTNAFVVTATFQVDAIFTAWSELELVSTADPQFYHNFTDDITWLSGELRVFAVRAGNTLFGVQLAMPTAPSDNATCALNFITQLLKVVNPAGGENLPQSELPAGSGNYVTSFDMIGAQEQDNPLYLSATDQSGVAVFNFALARVHMNSPVAAPKVRVFFRSCRASATNASYDAGPTNGLAFYRSYPATGPGGGPGDVKVPLFGVQQPQGAPQPEYVAIPFFAVGRVDPNVVSMDTQPEDTPNAQPMNASSGGQPTVQFFGCWLDINQNQTSIIPTNPPTSQTMWDGPFANATFPQGTQILPISQAFATDMHQCLIAEISTDQITIQPGDVPGYSAWLAQRNLGFAQ